LNIANTFILFIRGNSEKRFLSVVDRGDYGLPRAYTPQIAKPGRTILRTKPEVVPDKPEVALKVGHVPATFCPLNRR